MKAPSKLTRVKYEKENGIYTSHKEFLGNNGVLLNAQIDTTTKTLSVMQVTGELYSVVESQPYESFTDAKAVVKKLLQKYGVQFFDEIRRKKAKPIVTEEAS